MTNAPRRPLPARALRHGLSAAVLEDRATAETLDAAYAVHEALGAWHTAATYARALALEVSARGLTAHQSATFSVLYKGAVVGTLEADLLVDERLLVLVRADPTLSPEHKTDALRGLSAGGVRLGLVFNFGMAELSFARLL